MVSTAPDHGNGLALAEGDLAALAGHLADRLAAVVGIPEASAPLTSLDPRASLALRLWRAGAEIGPVVMDGKASAKAGGWGYVSHVQILARANAAFRRHGVIVMPTVRDHAREGVNRTILTVETVFANVDDPADRWPVTTIGYGNDFVDKGAAKAMTAAVKQAYAKVLGLTTLDDGEIQDAEEEPVEFEGAASQRDLADAREAGRTALASWARAFKPAIDKAETLVDLDRLRREGLTALEHPALPQETRDFLRAHLRERKEALARVAEADEGLAADAPASRSPAPDGRAANGRDAPPDGEAPDPLADAGPAAPATAAKGAKGRTRKAAPGKTGANGASP